MNIFEILTALLFPKKNVCYICGRHTPQEYVCITCAKSIKMSLPYCSVCGRYFTEHTILNGMSICSDCQEGVPPFLLARSAGPYQGALKEAIYILKYEGNRYIADYLGRLMAERFLNEPLYKDADLVVPVPLNEEKEEERGFNQSELLAQKLNKLLGVPTASVLIRTKNTSRQSDLSRKERLANIKGVFKTIESVQGRKILLVDDILTTGATVSECTRELLLAGAEKVYVLTLASGIREKL